MHIPVVLHYTSSELTCMFHCLAWPMYGLQRYGLLLSGEELSSFQSLRSSHYEVDFYLRQAEAALQQQQQQHEAPQQQQQALGQARLQRQLSSTVKNRRLAYMRRLEQQGEYFSEQTMRERQPLVWQDCIGGHMRLHPCRGPKVSCISVSDMYLLGTC